MTEATFKDYPNDVQTAAMARLHVLQHAGARCVRLLEELADLAGDGSPSDAARARNRVRRVELEGSFVALIDMATDTIRDTPDDVVHALDALSLMHVKWIRGAAELKDGKATEMTAYDLIVRVARDAEYLPMYRDNAWKLFCGIAMMQFAAQAHDVSGEKASPHIDGLLQGILDERPLRRFTAESSLYDALAWYARSRREWIVDAVYESFHAEAREVAGEHPW